MNILLIEDDLAQLNAVAEALKTIENQPVIHAFSDFDSAADYLSNNLPDLMLSDIMLGKHQDGGFELAKLLAQKDKTIPIVFFSERQDEYDILAGHDLGAVDYLAKPISLAVLERKVSNLLKLVSANKTENTSEEPENSLIKHLTIDTKNFRVFWQGKPLNLTITEFEMLEQFATTRPGSVITYQDLQTATQGVVERNTINSHICRIRNAFKKVAPEFDKIQNVYGRGYSWQQLES